MMLYLFIFIWLAIGAGSFLGGCYDIVGKVTISDLITAPLAGLFGPIILIMWFAFSESEKTWLNKTVWQRSDN